MPVGINQPLNQIKLTNVSLVRLKKGKKRFEIACYKDKVLEYRAGLEPDLDNVLQVPSVFLNVSKGQLAPTAELHKAFGADVSTDAIVLEILKKGELQVGEKERRESLERVHREVIDICAGRLVDPSSKRVYSPGMIEKALDLLSQRAAQARQEEGGGPAGSKAHGASSTSAHGSGAVTPPEGDGAAPKRRDRSMWTGVVATKSAKSQALEAMKALVAWQIIPVMRARMRLRVSCPVPLLKQMVKPPTNATAAEASSGATSGSGSGKKGKGKGAGSESTEVDGDPETSSATKRMTVKDRILSYMEEIQDQGEAGGDWEVTGFAEPGAFKGLGELIASETRGRGRIEVLDTAVVHEND